MGAAVAGGLVWQEGMVQTCAQDQRLKVALGVISLQLHPSLRLMLAGVATVTMFIAPWVPP
jgi:hypothetical protein